MLFMCGWAIVLLLRHEKNRVALERALADNRMLFQEIHHRVKNNLQQVASLAPVTAGAGADEGRPDAPHRGDVGGPPARNMRATSSEF